MSCSRVTSATFATGIAAAKVSASAGTRLMRAAGQDWYEQGDIWARLAAHRAGEHSPEPSPTTVAAVQQLITATTDTDDSPLRSAPAWPAAFDHAGRVLADPNQQGNLTRGLRAVLIHHLLFAFNRLGISAEHKHLLATAASQVVFQQQHAATTGVASSSTRLRATTVRAVTTDTIDPTTPDPEKLRTALADYICRRGTFRTPQVEAAFRTVPRHLFLPGVDLTTAYAPTQVVTKRAEDGTTVSSASSPNLVAEMLEALDVQPGDRVLEIGAATGINAALLAELVGPTGTVVTIELDDDLAAGAWDIACAWWQQLALGGRLVVPLRLHGSGLTRAIAFDLHAPGRMTSTSATVCGFVPCAASPNRPNASCHWPTTLTCTSTPGTCPTKPRSATRSPIPRVPTGQAYRSAAASPSPTLTYGWPPPAAATSAGSP
ncbi:MAG: thiopeptide-type bacteriocin biosynthesis protein [Pseudonocardiaceae bacterium]